MIPLQKFPSSKKSSAACPRYSIIVLIPVDIHHITLLHQYYEAILLPVVSQFVPDIVPAHLVLLAQVHALLHGAGPARQDPGAAVAIRIFVFLHVTDLE